MQLRIKELREERKLLQTELAKKLGVVPGTISNWENGVALPKTKHLQTLADALDVSISDLFNKSARPTK